ncbi:MAG: hypothetical protein JWO00_159 [Candidatus Parcubacteria bacterium]|nr:hypothetical protein [Candidatus Parcubacteria bacterium]
MTIFNKIFTFALIAILTIGPVHAFAQTAQSSRNPVNNPQPGYVPLEPLPCIPGGQVTCASQTQEIHFQDYVQYMFNLFIYIAAGAAVFMIVLGGFEYMTTDSWQGKSDGLNKVKNALLGLILVLVSYLILRTVDPRLVAIPTTLVKPLNINYQRTNDAFTSEFLADQAKYDADLANFRNNIQQAQANITSLEAQKTALQNKICAAGGNCESTGMADYFCGDVAPEDPMAADCTALRQTDDKLISARGTVTLNVAEAEMRTVLQQCAVGDTKCLENNNSSVNAVFSKYNSQLQPDQRAPLSAYQVYSSNLLNLSKQMGELSAADPNALSQGLAAVTKAVTTYSALPNADPVVASQMQAQLKETTIATQERINVINRGKTRTPCLGMNC